ncbi:OmpA family protein [bacterium]|nr:OmpA family protein [bacterium]
MKNKKNISFTSIIAIMAMFSALPAMAIDISGTVHTTDTGKKEPAAFATIQKPNTPIGTTTDENGYYELKNLNIGDTIQVSYVGQQTQTFAVEDGKTSYDIILSADSQTLQNFDITAKICSKADLQALHATKGVISKETEKCIPTKCEEPRYSLRNAETKTDEAGLTYTISGECFDTQGTPCNPMPDNATVAHMENGECVIKKCAEPQYRLINGTCMNMVGQDCTDKISHSVTATYQMDGDKLVCRVEKCDEPGYVPNDKKTKCDESDGPCTDTQIKAVANATAGSLRKGECVITACAKGYHPSKDGKKCDQAELSEKGSQDKINDLKDNAQAMKDKEQSTANKALGAAAIGATGIGGMNLMSGLAEQKADDAAEEDMKAYLATFVCDYGQGRNIRGGQTAIEVPGGNDLIGAATEYRALAADLKARKEALGKQPGIESEVIFDTAETGLYDNVGMGRQSGAYTSLSRALTDETSADAAAWAQQKADTASKVKIGAITAGAGAIGGLIGNLAINSGKDKKNQLNDILHKREYDKAREEIRKELSPIEKKSEQEAITESPQVEESKEEPNEILPDTTPKPEQPTIQENTPITPEADSVKPLFTLYDKSLFDSGKFDLKESAKTDLNTVIETLTNNIGQDTTFKIVLAAHTDSDRISPYGNLYKQGVKNNEQLGKKRGEAVKDYLITNGNNLFNTGNINVISLGDKCAHKGSKKQPVSSEQKAKDRKVDFYLLFGDEQLPEDKNYCDTGNSATPSASSIAGATTTTAKDAAIPSGNNNITSSSKTPLTRDEFISNSGTIAQTCENYNQNGVIGKFIIDTQATRWSSRVSAIHQRAYCIFVKKSNTSDQSGQNDPTIADSKPEYQEALKKFAIDGYVYAPDTDNGNRCESLKFKETPSVKYYGNALPTGKHGNYTACEFSYKFE